MQLLQRIKKGLWISLVIGALLLLFTPMAIAQTLDSLKPLAWKPYGFMGDVAYTSIRLDGYELFLIAAERKQDKDDQWGVENLQIRRNRIENRLKAQVLYLVENKVASESLQVVTAQLNQQLAVQVVLNGKPAKPILTVTSLDTEIYGLTAPELAEEYARLIQQGLLRALQERQANVLQSKIQRALIFTILTILITVILYAWQRKLQRIRQKLRQKFHHWRELLLPKQISLETDSQTLLSLSQQQRLLGLKHRVERKNWQIKLMKLSQISVCLLGLSWILQEFPESRLLGIWLFRQPIELLLIGLGTMITILVGHVTVDWLLTQWVGTEEQFPLAQVERRRRRSLTLSPVWKKVVAVFLGFIGFVLAFSLFSLSTGLTLFTEIGVLGLALSLAFQSAIKDAVAGSMFLTRDACAIGDLVVVKDIVGVVEEMGLVIIQIRSSPGELITLRNGEITYVKNLSRDWARMDFTVLVDYSTDIKKALATLKAVFQAMQTDPIWQPQLISEPDILGVENFNEHGILLKIRTQTQAGQQFNVTREFRLRLTQAFRQAGIKIPVPQREVQYRNAGSDSGSSNIFPIT